jgi:hypothetical protein
MEVFNFQDWGSPKAFWKGLVLGLMAFGLLLVTILSII